MVQPKIEGKKQGKPVMPYGSDGDDWIALQIDALGHLQVDVITTALASTGATEVTLNALLTELKLKADLLDTQPVSATALPLPTLASTSTLQGTMITALQSIQNLVGALGAVNLDRLRVESKDGDKIFGFNSVVEQGVADEDLDTGTNALNGAIVGDGEIWKITQIAMMYEGTPPSKMELRVPGLAGTIVLIYRTTIVSKDWYLWNGEIYMEKDAYIQLSIDGATLHDNAYFRYCGIQMSTP